MASIIFFCRSIESRHCPECHTTRERTNTGKNQEVNPILQGNGVEAYKIKIY